MDTPMQQKKAPSKVKCNYTTVNSFRSIELYDFQIPPYDTNWFQQTSQKQIIKTLFSTRACLQIH